MPFMLQNTYRRNKYEIKVGKRYDLFKQKARKIMWHKELYPTDYRKKNINAAQDLINFFMKGGKKGKARAVVINVFSKLFYLLVFEVPVFLKKKYKFFETLGQIILHDSTWFLINNLLTYYVNKIKPIFYIQSISIARTFRKKKKIFRINPYRFFLKTLPVYKRFNFGVRELSLYIKSVKQFSIEDKFFIGLLDLFMFDKKSFLFRKKIKCYRQALSTYIKEVALYT